ncbi:MAG: hypothetical protein AVDCRST_MAG41-223, partial [uncultured Corynebacteriales bacterium]
APRRDTRRYGPPRMSVPTRFTRTAQNPPDGPPGRAARRAARRPTDRPTDRRV